MSRASGVMTPRFYGVTLGQGRVVQQGYPQRAAEAGTNLRDSVPHRSKGKAREHRQALALRSVRLLTLLIARTVSADTIVYSGGTAVRQMTH